MSWTRRKRGRRGGCLVRLQRRRLRPPLPGIFFGNVNSLPNKMEDLQVLRVFAMVETHLSATANPRSAQASDNLTLVNDLNNFHHRFDSGSPHDLFPVTVPQNSPHHLLSVTEREVILLLKGQNPRKAVGPDAGCSAVLEHCDDQLTPMYTNIFNTSPKLCHVPACLKAATLIQVPQKTTTRTCSTTGL